MLLNIAVKIKMLDAICAIYSKKENINGYSQTQHTPNPSAHWPFGDPSNNLHSYGFWQIPSYVKIIRACHTHIYFYD